MLLSDVFKSLQISNNTQNQIIESFSAMRNVGAALRNAMQPLQVIIPNIADTFAQIQKQINQIKIINEKIRADGFDAALHILTFSDILDITNENELEESFYRKTTEPEFVIAILENCKRSKIFSHRHALIEEAINLHCNKFFYGAVTLSLSQIEGIINDFLIFHKIAYYDETRAVRIDNKRILGIKRKIGSILELDFSNTSLLQELDDRAFLTEENSRTGINDIRNDILHGSNVDFGSRRMSTQIILWLYALALEVEYTRKISEEP